MTTIADLVVDRSPRDPGVALIVSGQDPSDPTRWVKVSVIRDEDPPALEDDNRLGTFVHGHPRYGLHGKQMPRGLDVATYFAQQGVDPQTVLSLPVYLLDHSGLALSTTSFNDMWDSGQVGVIYVTAERLVEEYGDDSAASRQRATTALTAEIAEINDYLSGNVYGYRSEEAPSPEGPWEPCDEVWGFVGSDFASMGIDAHLDDGERAVWRAAVGAPPAPAAASPSPTSDSSPLPPETAPGVARGPKV